VTIYLDMDGVIADFFNGLARRYGVSHWKSIQDREIKFRELANTDFFYNLDIFPTTYELVKRVKSVAAREETEWGICSSPLRGDRDNSAYWKRQWLNRWDILPPLVENMIFTSNKHKYAISPLTRRPNILIDDKPENISRWNEAGGIGIRYQANEDDLEEYLFVELEKACKLAKY